MATAVLNMAVALGVAVPDGFFTAALVGVGVVVDALAAAAGGETTVNGSERNVPIEPFTSIVRVPLVAVDGTLPVQLAAPVVLLALAVQSVTAVLELR